MPRARFLMSTTENRRVRVILEDDNEGFNRGLATSSATKWKIYREITFEYSKPGLLYSLCIFFPVFAAVCHWSQSTNNRESVQKFE